MNLVIQRQERRERAITAAVFGFGLTLAAMVPEQFPLAAPIWAALGLSIPAGARWLWGERTRPKMNGFWLTAGLGGLIASLFLSYGIEASLNLYFASALLVGFYLMHDMAIAPTLMVTMGTATIVFRSEIGFRWDQVPEARVWFIALASLACLSAALLERDRLSRRQGYVTPGTWMLIRIAFLSIWTVLIILLRKGLNVGSLYEKVLGIDLSRTSGRITLLAVLAVTVVLSALVFRMGRKRPRAAAPRNV